MQLCSSHSWRHRQWLRTQARAMTSARRGLAEGMDDTEASLPQAVNFLWSRFNSKHLGSANDRHVTFKLWPVVLGIIQSYPWAANFCCYVLTSQGTRWDHNFNPATLISGGLVERVVVMRCLKLSPISEGRQKSPLKIEMLKLIAKKPPSTT